jgi:acetolactate synthase-1/2/3 large subunit
LKVLPPDIDDNTISFLIEKLKSASKPAIIAGGGVRSGKAKNEFDTFVKQLNIPVMTAWNSHDLITDDDPLYAGRPGTIGTRGGNFVFQNSDLLLVIGCRMSLRQIGYVWDKLAPNAYKIMVDIDKNEMMKKSFKADYPVHGDCLDFLKKMIASGYRKESVNHDSWKNWCRNINLKYSPLNDIVKTDRLNPYSFFDQLFKLLPEDQLVITSNGSACVIPFQIGQIKNGQRLFTNGGCASMGFGLPAAIGGCVSSGNKKTICIEGDGSIQMNIQELQTVSHYKLPMIIFLVNNNGYHSIRQTQTNFFKSRFAGVDAASGISFPDFGDLAKGYGLKYNKIDSEKNLEEEIASVLSSEYPVLCEIVVDQNQSFVPKSSSKILPDGKMVSAPIDDMYPFLSESEMNQNVFKGEM